MQNLRKKLCAVMLVFMMTVTMMPVMAFAQSKTAVGSWADAADVSWFNSTNKKPSYTLSTARQLAGFAKLVSGGESFDKTVIVLSADIDLGGKLWSTAGKNTAFKGVFDGKDHIIKDLTIEETENGSGFIRALDGAVVKNIEFQNTDLSVEKKAGTICGFSENGSKILNVTASGSITGTGNWIGGITGNNRNSQIVNCNTDMTLTSNSGTTYGLLAGWSGGDSGSEIKGCVATGSVSASEWCGGAVGSSENTKYESVSTDATVTSTGNSANTGGLLGQSVGDSLFFCSSSGSVIHDSGAIGGNTGGLVGWFENGIASRCSSEASVEQKGSSGIAGGLMGYLEVGSNSMIEESMSTDATVSGTDNSTVGGLVGVSRGLIKNCYSTNNVITGGQLDTANLSATAGAFIGIQHQEGQVKNCYGAGNATAGKSSDNGDVDKKIRASRFIADRRGGDSGITNCYYKSDSILTNNSPAKLDVTEAGTAKSETELKDSSMITSLNVDTDVWGAKNADYPILNNMGKADYTAVNNWITTAKKLDETKYVDFSGVEKAVEDVTFYLNRSKQSQVDGYATAIENAIKALVEKQDPPPTPDIHTHTPAADDGDCTTAVLCTSCGAVVTAAKTHDFSGSWQTDADSHWQSCGNAGCVQVTDKAAHTWDNGVVTNEPTIEKEGVKTFTCTTCTKTKTETIDKLPTKEEIVDSEMGMKIEYEDGTKFDEAVELKVKPQPSKAMDKYKEAVNKVAKGLTLASLYDIKLLKDGGAIQPGGKIKITISLTKEMKARKNLNVVYISDGGKATVIPSTISKDKITFVTDELSGYYGIIGKATAKIAAPKTVKARALTMTTAKVSWSKVSKATEYAIYKSTTKTGDYTLAKKVKGVTTTVSGLKANKAYYFKVRAKGSDGYSSYSTAAAAKTKKCPCGKDHSKAWFKLKQASKSTVKVTWTRQKGATAYQVANNHTSNKAMKIKWTGNNKQNCYLSLGKAKGKNYLFKMRTVTVKNGKNAYSSWTSPVCITMK